MKIVKPTVELIKQEPGLQGIYKQIELAGRACYASSHRIGEGTAEKFVNMMVESGHGAMLEHGTVYLLMQYGKGRDESDRIEKYIKNKYSRVTNNDLYYITTNYRVLVENGWLDDLKYLCNPTECHQLRATARFQCQIAISREFNRHRVDSIAEQSTRYCNYAKDKFGNEISINLPVHLNDRESIVTDPTEYLEFSEMCKAVLFDNHKAVFEDVDYWLFANLACEFAYLNLIERGWKAQQARTILPLDTNTDLVHTAFIDDWKHFFNLRCDKAHAHPDAYNLASQLEGLFREEGLL